MQYNGNQDVRVVRRYFVGTTVLANGQILCFQDDASATDADPKLRLGNAVQVVDSGSINLLAGVVPASEAGKTGPCFVELEVPSPGDVVKAQVNGATDVVAGDLLELDATKGCFIKATAAAGDNLFRSLEAETADSNVAHLVYKI